MGVWPAVITLALALQEGGNDEFENVNAGDEVCPVVLRTSKVRQRARNEVAHHIQLRVGFNDTPQPPLAQAWAALT